MSRRGRRPPSSRSGRRTSSSRYSSAVAPGPQRAASRTPIRTAVVRSPADARREGEGMPEGTEAERHARRPAARSRARSLGEKLRRSRLLLEGRDLGEVEDVEDVDAVAGGDDAAVVVGGEVAERVRGGDGRQRPARASSGERDQSALHRASLRATGAQSSEKCGLSASARRNQPRASRRVAEAALDHPAVEELERVLRAEAQRVLRVRKRLRAAAVPLQRPAEHVVAVDARPLALSGAGRARATARSRIPWSTRNRAISRSVRTPFAASSRRIASISAYSRAAAVRFPAVAVEVAERRDELRQRDARRRRGARARIAAGRCPRAARTSARASSA